MNLNFRGFFVRGSALEFHIFMSLKLLRFPSVECFTLFFVTLKVRGPQEAQKGQYKMCFP